MNKTPPNYALWFSIISIITIVIILSLSLYTGIKCPSNLCITRISITGDSAPSLLVEYRGLLLPNSKMTVTLNGKYSDMIKTNSRSFLNFSAPLRIGPNIINVSYLNSTSQVSFFYLAGMQYMLLIPLSALIFILIRFTSSNLRSSAIALYIQAHSDSTFWEDFATLAKQDSQKPTREMIIGLPQSTNSLLNELNHVRRLEGRGPIFTDITYLATRLQNLGQFKSFCYYPKSEINELAVAAKKFYEVSIENGWAINPNVNSISEFIKTNKILLLKDISIGSLSFSSKSNSKINVIIMEKETQHNAILRKLISASELGSALLLLSICGRLRIIE